MPNDNSANGGTANTTASQANFDGGDLQIKPMGGAGPNAQASTSAVAQPVPVAVTPLTDPIPQAVAQPTAVAESNSVAPAAPVNKRAFNLEADVDAASTGPVIPEKYAIPKLVKEKYPDLVELIKTTESMDDQERQYWFQIMPIMSEEQIDKFRNILITEKQQLADLDKEYEDELNRLNEKHLIEWKEFESKEKSRAIKEAEAQDEQQDKKLEEDLLAKLSDV